MLQIKMRHDKDRNKADNNPRDSSPCSVRHKGVTMLSQSLTGI